MLIIKSWQEGSFRNAFSSNLNTVNMKKKISSAKVRYRHLKIKPWPGNRIMEGFIPGVNIWEVPKVVLCSLSLMLTLTLSTNILFEKLAPQIGDWIWKSRSAHYASGFGSSMQSLSSFLISFSDDLWCFYYRTLLDLPSYWSDSGRRCTEKGVCCYAEGKMNNSLGISCWYSAVLT